MSKVRRARAITHLNENSVPKSEVDKEKQRKISILLSRVINFSPERKPIKEENIQNSRLAKQIQQENDLIKNFYDRLYVDRVERREIQSVLVSRHVIFVLGLPGIGKTVLAKKMGLDYKNSGSTRFIYIDFKKMFDDYPKLNGANCKKNTEATERAERAMLRVLYNKIFDKYIEKAPDLHLSNSFYIYNFYHNSEMLVDLLKSRLIRKGIRDPRYSKENIKYIEGDRDILGFIMEEHGKRLRENPHAFLRALIDFLQEDVTLLVICFDNVDRLDNACQQMLEKLSIDLANETEVSIIITVRNYNFKRMKERIDSDMTWRETFNPDDMFSKGKVRMIVKEINNPDRIFIKEVLDKRIDYVLQDRDFFQYFVDSDRDFINGYKRKFSKMFDIISKVTTESNEKRGPKKNKFINQGIFSISNKSIRHMLLLYGSFVNNLLFNPEKFYSFKNLLDNYNDKDMNITRIRTFFYKWATSNTRIEDSIPIHGIYPREGFLNIYDDFSSEKRIKLLDLRILEYLYNISKGHRKRSPVYHTVGKIKETFSYFGIDESETEESLRKLSSNGNKELLGFISIDCSNRDSDVELAGDCETEILPAGEFFLDPLSASSEYAFWAAINANLDSDIVGMNFNYEETYSDKFKLDVIIKFIEEILIPQFEKESEFVKAKSLKRYNEFFSIRHNMYPHRLIKSLEAFIRQGYLVESVSDKGLNFSPMKEETKANYTKKLITLENQFDEIIPSRW